MANRIESRYKPNYVSPPGETLEEMINAIGMSQSELAERTGRPKKTINEIIKGKAAITQDTALQLERVLGTPASFWNNREQHYRAYLARIREEESLQNQLEWLKAVPIKAMIVNGWILHYKDKIEQLQEVLNFFGVASPERWREVWISNRLATFRKSKVFKSDSGAVAAWLRKGELQAQQLQCAPYDAKVFREILVEIRAMTVEPVDVFQDKIIEKCAHAGVALIFLPELPKLRVSGAARWLSPNKALIQLSLYQNKSDDRLWFNFSHEACHILKHGKKIIFVDEGNGIENEIEQDANSFAQNFLIPSATFQQFVNTHTKRGRFFSTASIEQFAEKNGIAPGIVVGRLQHEGLLKITHCNGLKRRLEWAS